MASTENPTDGQRWFIEALIGPCSDDDRDVAMDRVQAALHGERFGASVAAKPFDAAPVVPERGQDERRWYLVPIRLDGQPAWRVRGPAPADSPSREIPVMADVSSPAYFPPGVARVVPARPLDDTDPKEQR